MSFYYCDIAYETDECPHDFKCCGCHERELITDEMIEDILNPVRRCIECGDEVETEQQLSVCKACWEGCVDNSPY